MATLTDFKHRPITVISTSLDLITEVHGQCGKTRTSADETRLTDELITYLKSNQLASLVDSRRTKISAAVTDALHNLDNAYFDRAVYRLDEPDDLDEWKYQPLCEDHVNSIVYNLATISKALGYDIHPSTLARIAEGVIE